MENVYKYIFECILANKYFSLNVALTNNDNIAKIKNKWTPSFTIALIMSFFVHTNLNKNKEPYKKTLEIMKANELLNNKPNFVGKYIDYTDGNPIVYNYSLNIFNLLSDNEVYIKNKRPSDIMLKLLSKITDDIDRKNFIELHNELDKEFPIIDLEELDKIV